MRAAIVTDPTGPDDIVIVDVPTPVPGSGEIRIRIEAAGINPADVQTAGGVYHRLGWVTLPRIGLGWDAAGVVDAVGDAVTGFEIGDPVAALSGGVDKPLGTFADFVVVPASAVAHRPAGLDAVEAATVPLNALTASQALDLLGDPAGRSLLVTGAAGAVGGYATQLAAERGYAVTGLARESDRVFVESAGARLLTTLGDERFDAVLDAAVLDGAALATVRDNGQYVGVIPPAVPESVRGISTAAVMVVPDGARLTTLLDRAADGSLPTRVHSTRPLHQIAAAHRDLAKGGLRGRIVLTA